MAGEDIRIGVVVTLVGPYASLGEDSLRGVQQAVAQFDGQITARKIVPVTESSSGIPASATEAVSKLLDKHQVAFTIGPLTGSEGLALRDYAKNRSDRVFLNGNAAAQDMTLRDPAPNFFSFSTNGVQWMAGLGTYVYEALGYRRVVTIGEDYSFPHSQVGGFMIEYCAAGGKVVEKSWVPLGNRKFETIISALPTDIDAILVALGGADVIHFLEQYVEAGGKTPLIGAAVAVDQSTLSTRGSLGEHVVGMVSSGPIADDIPDPAWQEYVRNYRELFPDGLESPSLLAYGYYVNTLAALLALKQIDCDLSDDQAAFKNALGNLAFDTPTGPVRLDHNRNAIAHIFIREVSERADGRHYNKLIKTIPEVNQTLGMPEDEYLQIGALTRDNPSCP